MTRWARLSAVGTVLAVGATVLAVGATARGAQATPAAWLAPVARAEVDASGADSRASDASLDAALRRAMALVAPERHWQFGRPGATQCPQGCEVVEVHRHDGDHVHYTVTVLHVPQGSQRSLALEAPVDLPVFELAQALALHTVFLLAEPAPPPDPPRDTSHPAVRTVPAAWSLSLGPTLTRAWRSAFATGGTEVGASLHTSGHLRLGAAIGVESYGAGHGTLARSQVRMVPATVLAGAGWSVGPVNLGASAGVRVAAWAVEGRLPGAEDAHDLDVSAVAEARVAWQWRDLLSIALTVRPSYVLEANAPLHHDPAPTRIPAPASASPSALFPRGLVQAGAAIVVPL